MISRDLTVLDNVTTILLFLEFLANSGLSSRVIHNYVSALKFLFDSYAWSTAVVDSSLIKRTLRGIKFLIRRDPIPKDIFSFQQIHEICQLCGAFDNPITYRSAFLLGFYGFLRILNVAPPFAKSFLNDKHLLRQDATFASPGLHLNFKWTQNIQAPEKTHTIKLPYVQDPMLCPTQSIASLLDKISFPLSAPLLVFPDGSLLTQPLMRKRLATILRLMDLPLLGFGYHTFRRSRATLAFDSNIALQNIKMHGAWQSDAVCTYILDNPSLTSPVSLPTFSQLPNIMLIVLGSFPLSLFLPCCKLHVTLTG